MIDGANRAVLALNPANDLVERTRVWPIRGGLKRWHAELAAQRLTATDASVRALIDDMRAIQGSD